jgi:phosphoenolpyruvate carboxylase
VPSFSELKVQRIVNQIPDDSNIWDYLPLKPRSHQYERTYFFTIIASLRYDFLKKKIEEAKKNRGLEEVQEDDKMIEISEEWMNEFLNSNTYKSKFSNNTTAT